MAHAYSIISTFSLKSEDGKEEHRLYMLKNPWAHSHTNTRFRGDDPIWTKNYINQVPYGIDPRTSENHGIFFLNHTDMHRCI